MTVLLKGILVAGLLGGTPMTPAFAQWQDNHRQVQQRNNHQHQAQQRRNVPKYREVAVSRGNKWRKGQRLARNQQRYVISDWNQRGLRAPPRGYRWVRENNTSGDYLLVAVATGLIASILAQ